MDYDEQSRLRSGSIQFARDDPFYSFGLGRESVEPPVDHGIHDQLNDYLPFPSSGGGGGGGASLPPLNGYLTAADKLKVQSGTVDGVEVTAAGGGALDDAEFTVASGDRLWLKVTLAAANGAVSTAEVVTTDPGADTATVGSRLILQVTGTTGSLSVANYLGGSQDHDSCGADHSFILS